jgi:hypothetical protein
MPDGLSPIVERDLPQARWLYQSYSDPPRFIMRSDFDVTTRCDDSVDRLPDRGLVIDDVDQNVPGTCPKLILGEGSILIDTKNMKHRTSP